MSFVINRLNQFFAAENKNRIQVLDGIKSISILLVVYFHIFWMLGDHISIPQLDRLLLSPGMPVLTNLNGVIDTFFLIAAFLGSVKLIRLFELKKFNYGQYVFGRLLRFMPVMAVVIAVYILAGLYNPESCWANLFYINIFLDFNKQCMVWSWYLTVQEQYMLIFAPLFAYILFKFPRTAWWISAAAGSLLVYIFRMDVILTHDFTMPLPFHVLYNRELFADYFTSIYTMPHTRILPLLAGSILGWAYARTGFFQYAGKIRLRWTIPSLLILALFVLPNFLTVSIHHGTWIKEAAQLNLALTRHGSTFLFSLFLILLVSENRVVKYIGKFLSLKIWHFISELTLLIYLYHLIVIDVLYRIVKPADPWFPELFLYFFIAILISSAMAVITNVLVERTLREWIYKLLKQKEERVTAP